MLENRITELLEMYKEALEEWQIKLAISRLQRFRIPQDHWEDAMQELAIMICRFKFDPAKAHAASKETILCRRIDNRIRMLARKNARDCGRIERLGQMRIEEEDGHSPDIAAAEAEVREVIASLTPQQQEICKALMGGESVPEYARRIGCHWSIAYRQVEHVRRAFMERGYDKWSK